jgi:hypothetical protein
VPHFIDGVDGLIAIHAIFLVLRLISSLPSYQKMKKRQAQFGTTGGSLEGV